jgi:hypothetical protein
MPNAPQVKGMIAHRLIGPPTVLLHGIVNAGHSVAKFGQLRLHRASQRSPLVSTASRPATPSRDDNLLMS